MCWSTPLGHARLCWPTPQNVDMSKKVWARACMCSPVDRFSWLCRSPRACHPKKKQEEIAGCPQNWLTGNLLCLCVCVRVYPSPCTARTSETDCVLNAAEQEAPISGQGNSQTEAHFSILQMSFRLSLPEVMSLKLFGKTSGKPKAWVLFLGHSRKWVFFYNHSMSCSEEALSGTSMTGGHEEGPFRVEAPRKLHSPQIRTPRLYHQNIVVLTWTACLFLVLVGAQTLIYHLGRIKQGSFDPSSLSLSLSLFLCLFLSPCLLPVHAPLQKKGTLIQAFNELGKCKWCRRVPVPPWSSWTWRPTKDIAHESSDDVYAVTTRHAWLTLACVRHFRTLPDSFGASKSRLWHDCDALAWSGNDAALRMSPCQGKQLGGLH